MDAKQYVIVARMSVVDDGPLLYAIEGMETLEKARKLWAYLSKQRQAVRDKEQAAREERERIKEAGRRAKAEKKAS